MATDSQGRGPDGLMTWPDLLGRPKPRPDAEQRYGQQPLQLVDVWLPAGRGPHPVVLMVHGGCWQTEIADRTIMNWIADDLKKRGIAVWNIEYRGVDRGGGYPATFNDVSEAADALAMHGPDYELDTGNVVVVGHSAGGHLGLWLAGRHRLPADSEIRSSTLAGPERAGVVREYHPPIPPLRIRKVVSLGGLPDLEEAARSENGCGPEVIGQLTGGHFADTSVPRLAPLGVEQVLINGEQDRIIPTAYAEGYAKPMRAAGDKVSVRVLAHTGHVELIAPESAAWKAAVEEIQQAFRQ